MTCGPLYTVGKNFNQKIKCLRGRKARGWGKQYTRRAEVRSAKVQIIGTSSILTTCGEKHVRRRGTIGKKSKVPLHYTTKLAQATPRAEVQKPEVAKKVLRGESQNAALAAKASQKSHPQGNAEGVGYGQRSVFLTSKKPVFQGRSQNKLGFRMMQWFPRVLKSGEMINRTRKEETHSKSKTLP